MGVSHPFVTDQSETRKKKTAATELRLLGIARRQAPGPGWDFFVGVFAEKGTSLILGSGFKYFLFSPLFREDSYFD